MDDEDQRNREASSRSPFTELNQVSSDFAMAIQEQERLATIESESSNNEDDDDYDEEITEFADDNFLNYDFDSFEADELQFLEGQDSNTDEDNDDDDDDDDDDGIDVDELTYEELIALGEFIGQEKRGLSFNEISKCMHGCKYYNSSSVVDNKAGIDRCVICQVEYEEGESMVALIPCEHPYHSECISGWLRIKKICPICGTEVSPQQVPKNNNDVITSKL